MKNIIVPIDFSELSLYGLNLALLLSKEVDAKIELVHVIKRSESIPFGKEKINTEHIKEAFENILEKYSKENQQIKISSVIKEGKIHEEINNQAESSEDSIIVTSTHGMSGWEELFTGSNAYKIVASSTRPVFTIRGNRIPNRIKKIVLPLDITQETREKVPFTAKLAKLFEAEVHVVSVRSADYEDVRAKINDYNKQVSKYLTHHGIKNSSAELKGNNITDITIDYAKKVNADLISIMTEQETNISNILLGSYAHQMINKSPVPVLLFPTKQIGIITDYFKTEGIYY